MKRKFAAVLRLVLLFIIVLLVAGTAPLVESGLWLVAASPWVAFCSALALRSVGVLSLAALPLFALGLIKGRWFCYRLCPVGCLLDLVGKLNRRGSARLSRIPLISYWLLALGTGGALVAAPLAVWLDPFVLFNGFFGLFGDIPSFRQTWLPATGLGVIICLTVLLPGIWCRRLCPLGAGLELLHSAFRRIRAVTDKRSPETGMVGSRRPGLDRGPVLARRSFLMFLAGAGAGPLLRLFVRSGASSVIRPPGAITEESFVFLCARCGNCFQACPEKIIVPDTGTSGLTGVITPLLKFDSGYCVESCNRCGHVCPTGAIQPLVLKEKQATAIGLAHIEKNRCLAWEHGAYCMICREYCPYHAIEFVENKGVKCPVVNETACRGCGACESRCPVQPLRAVLVRGL